MSSPRGTQGKVARRIVVLFVLCAVVPVMCLALVASSQVTGELRQAGRQRLHQTAKSVGIEILDQLRRIDSDLALIETMLTGGPASPLTLPRPLEGRLSAQFLSLAAIAPDGTSRVLVGTNPPNVHPTAEESAHLKAGKALLSVVPGSLRPRLIMTRFLASRGSGHLLSAEIDDTAIWNRDSAPPPLSVHVLSPSLDALFSSSTPPASALGEGVLKTIASSSTGETEWTHDGERYFARYWSLPLAFDFLTPDWKVVVSESSEDMLAPIRSSRITFVLVTMLSLFVVAFLSLSQVRRSMVPLAQLREGTQRLGRGDFAGRVEIHSGDEFEELAGSFNTMASQLKRQFDTLSAMAELDRAVLSSLDVETIVHGTLDRLPRLIGCDHMAVIVLGPPSSTEGRAFVTTRPGGVPRELVCTITPRMRVFLAQEIVISMRLDADIPDYLTAIVTPAWATCTVFPLVFGDRLLGILAVGDRRATERSAEDLQHARQLATQVGVALSNADLVQALDRLNVGTLSALARTVDAKSPWTAGHSQRVTEMAVEIGRAMGVDAKSLEALARGGLLHDIGKIAIPTSILNKQGALTPQEFALMREHPQIGARILEPIPEYGYLIPIVLQHHEWFDGRGYPFGLAGEAIDQGARILAVADVFDALTSKRPYRDAMSLEVAVNTIRAGRGTQFEPRVVDAFLTLLNENALHPRQRILSA
jgi:putative nucleotidyltransferase with HDIG domain